MNIYDTNRADKNSDRLYRVVDYRDSSPSGVNVMCISYPIVRYTPCGAWIQCNDVNSGKKFVKLEAHKKYAHASVAEAIESFIRRKKRQQDILRNQLKRASAAECIARAEIDNLDAA